MNNSIKQLWSAKEDDDTECELDRVTEENGSVKWQLAMTKGNFSGYPVINLSSEDIAKLYVAIRDDAYAAFPIIEE